MDPELPGTVPTTSRPDTTAGAESAGSDVGQAGDAAARIAELERRLRRLEARFHGIVGIAADAVISVDASQRIVFFNQGAEQIFGWSASEILGQPLDVLIPPASRLVHRKHMSDFGAGQEEARRMGHRRPIAGVRRSGEEFPAEASISKHTVDGETLYHVVLRDVTDDRRAEAQQRFLAEAGELLTASLDVRRTLARAAAAAIPRLADACAVWLQEDDALHPLAASAIHEGEPGRFLARLTATPLPLDSPHVAAVVAARGGSERFVVGDASTAAHRLDVARIVHDVVAGPDAPPLGASGAPVIHGLVVAVSAAGETNGVLALYRKGRPFEDDTVTIASDFARRLALAVDNGRLYERAQRAIRARDETIAVVSHDLRNPVNAITMLGGVLLRRADDPSVTLQQVRDELDTIVRGARQADALIQDLLDVARIEAGRLQVERAPVDLLRLLRETAELLRPLATDRELALELELPDELPTVAADAERVQQVLSNLVGNAVKFTERGGRLTIAAAATDGEVHVRVEDTGSGIEPDHLANLFDRYWQGNPRTRRGAGLGLAIAKGIVEAHGGRMWVESTVGVGSRFWFSLPV